MDVVSLLLAGGIALLTWRAYRRGLVRELVSLASLLLAIPIAGVLYDDMTPKVEPLVANRTLAQLVSFLSILFAVVMGGQVAGYALRRGVELLDLGAVDRLAGGAFGFVTGVLLAQVVLLALVVFPSPDVRGGIHRSPVGRFLLETTPLVVQLLPDPFEGVLDEFLGKGDVGVTADGEASPRPVERLRVRRG